MGEGATESTTHGCKPSSTDETGTDVALFPGWTAPTATAAFATPSETATVPEGLVGRDVFLLQRHVVRTLTIRFRFCSQDGRRKRRRGVSL